MADDDAALMAAGTLEPLFRAQESYEDLLDLLDRRASTSDSPDTRFALFIEMAELAESKLDDPDRAFEWYGHALMTRAGSQEALDALMRLAAANERMWSVVDLIESVLHDCYESDTAVRLGLLAARTRRDALDDIDGAKDGYLAVLEHEGDNREAIAALESIFEHIDEPEGLADILGRRIANQDGDMALVQCRLAELHEDELGNPEQALSLYRDVLLDTPGYEKAIDGLLRLVPIPETAEEAAETVLPILRASERWTQFIEVLQSRLTELDGDERVEALTTIASTYEQLDEHQSALAFHIQAFELEPDLTRFEKVNTLTGTLDQPHMLVDAAFNVMESLHDPSVAEIVLLAGANAAEQEDDLGRQESLLVALVEISPENTEALDALEMLYRRKGSPERVLDVIRQKAEAIYDAEARTQLYLQMAAIAETELSDIHQAQEFLDEVLTNDPRNLPAYDELIRLAEGQDDWAMALEVLERKAEVMMGEEVIPVRLRMGELAVIYLDAPEAAVDAYQDVLSIAPSHPEALDALAKLFREQEAWDDLHSVLRQQLDTAASTASRTTLLEALSELAEVQLMDIDSAIEYQRQRQARA